MDTYYDPAEIEQLRRKAIHAIQIAGYPGIRSRNFQLRAVIITRTLAD
jgi:hypothetical protein